MSSLTGSMGPTGSMSSSGRTGMPKEKIPKGYKKGTLNNFTPEQMQLFQQMFGQLGPESYLSKLAGGDEETFNQMEAPALKQFAGLQGGLASRFSGMGGTGARNSSGFQNTANQAASDFAQQLQSQRQELQRGAISDMMNFSNQLLNQRPQENFLVEKPQKQKQALGGWGGALGALGGGAAGFFAGGPAGALAGAKLGSSAFGGM